MLRGMKAEHQELRRFYTKINEGQESIENSKLRKFYEKVTPNVIPVDEWECPPEDEYFKQIKGALWLPVSEYFGIKISPSKSTHGYYYIAILDFCYYDNSLNPIYNYLHS